MPSFETAYWLAKRAWSSAAHFLMKLLLWISPRPARIGLSHLWGNYLQSQITRNQQEINRKQEGIDQIEAEHFAELPLETCSLSELKGTKTLSSQIAGGSTRGCHYSLAIDSKPGEVMMSPLPIAAWYAAIPPIRIEPLL